MKGQTHQRPVLTIRNPSSFLRDMVREDSNHELDWLWAADQVTMTEEIHYCLERALYINPNNRDTRRMLSKLAAQRITVNEVLHANGQGFAQSSDH